MGLDLKLLVCDYNLTDGRWIEYPPPKLFYSFIHLQLWERHPDFFHKLDDAKQTADWLQRFHIPPCEIAGIVNERHTDGRGEPLGFLTARQIHKLSAFYGYENPKHPIFNCKWTVAAMSYLKEIDPFTPVVLYFH